MGKSSDVHRVRDFVNELSRLFLPVLGIGVSAFSPSFESLSFIRHTNMLTNILITKL